MTERRLQPRLSDSDLVLISWHENGTRLNELANVTDLSVSGTGIALDRAVPVGTAVTVT